MMQSLRQNLGYKLISLGIAILLYVVAYGQRNPRMAQSVYVTPEVENLGADMVVQRPPEGHAVTVTGSPSAVEVLAERGLRAFVDASGAKPGTVTLPLRYDIPEDLRGRVQIAQRRQVAKVTLDQRASKAAAVQVPALIPPAGYEFAAVNVTPDQVQVTGLRSDVERVDRVVARLNNNRPAGAIDETAPLVALDDSQQVVSGVDIRPTRARVRIGIREYLQEKSVVLSPEPVGRVARGFRLVGVDVEPRTVTVQGPLDRVKSLTQLSVPVEVSGLSRDTTRTVTITPPDGTRLKDGGEVTVSINVQPEEAAPAPPPAAGDAPDDSDST